jgi:hypothetical protein
VRRVGGTPSAASPACSTARRPRRRANRSASSTGDVAKVLRLMSDNAALLVPGRLPFGKQKFASALRAGREAGGRRGVAESKVICDWTSASPPGETVMPREGALHFDARLQADALPARARWPLGPDANLMSGDCSRSSRRPTDRAVTTAHQRATGWPRARERDMAYTRRRPAMGRESKANKGDHKVTKAAGRPKAKAPRGKPANPGGRAAKRSPVARRAAPRGTGH